MSEGFDIERARAEWDARARENARHFIATGVDDWARFALFGLHDAHRILTDLQDHVREGQALLEIGCGIGRLLRFFAQVFESVRGIDISQEMVERSVEYLQDCPNARVVQGDGRSLAPFEDGSFDFVVSYAVMQHIPEPAWIRAYFLEAGRVLRPGGRGKFLVRTGDWPDEPAAPTSWHGAKLDHDQVRAWCDDAGVSLEAAYSMDESCAWVVFRRGAVNTD